MKLMAYAKILKLGKEAVRATLAPVRAHEMKKQAQLEVAKIDSKIVEHQSSIQSLSAEYPIKYDALIRAIDDLALLERRKRQLQKIINEMFPA